MAKDCSKCRKGKSTRKKSPRKGNKFRQGRKRRNVKSRSRFLGSKLRRIRRKNYAVRRKRQRKVSAQNQRKYVLSTKKKVNNEAAKTLLEYVLGEDISHEYPGSTEKKISCCPCVKFCNAVMSCSTEDLQQSSSVSEASCSSCASSSDSDTSHLTANDVPSGSAGVTNTQFARSRIAIPRYAGDMIFCRRCRSTRLNQLRNSEEYGWYRKPRSVASVLFPSCGPPVVEYVVPVRKVNSFSTSDSSEKTDKTDSHQSTFEQNLNAPGPSGSPFETTLLGELEDDEDLPSPSGAKKPTFISMVKTAIRDLRPFRITSMEAISKYIHLRYKVKNDHLLKYILDWMVDMNILCNWSGHYFFTKKRLVKKTTVAVLPGSQNARQRPECALKLNQCRKKKKRKLRKRHGSKEKEFPAEFDYKIRRKCKLDAQRAAQKSERKCRKRRGDKIRENALGCFQDAESEMPLGIDSDAECMKAIKQSKPKKKKCVKGKRKKRKKGKNGDKCTCSKELSSAKNRIKLRTRYVRRGGKIYKEEEFI